MLISGLDPGLWSIWFPVTQYVWNTHMPRNLRYVSINDAIFQKAIHFQPSFLAFIGQIWEVRTILWGPNLKACVVRVWYVYYNPGHRSFIFLMFRTMKKDGSRKSNVSCCSSGEWLVVFIPLHVLRELVLIFWSPLFTFIDPTWPNHLGWGKEQNENMPHPMKRETTFWKPLNSLQDQNFWEERAIVPMK